MKCEEVMETMQRYLDEDLNPKEVASMREHMKQCASCAEMFERLNRLSEELVNLPKVEPPYSIVDSILPKLQEIDRQAPAGGSPAPAAPLAERRRKRRNMYRLIGGAAAAVIFIGAAVYQLPQFLSSNSAEDASFAGSSNSSAAEDSSGSNEMSIMMSAESTSSNAASEQRSFDAEDQADAAPDLPDKQALQKAAPPEKEIVDFGGKEEVPPSAGSGTDSRSPEGEPRLEVDAPRAGLLQPPKNQAVPDDRVGVRFYEQVLELAQSEAVPSPDNAFFAFVEHTDVGYQVVIAAENGERIYASPAKQADGIRSLVWSETGASLSYELVEGDSVQTFTIDVRTRTERQNQ
jgi:hypothetical protein